MVKNCKAYLHFPNNLHNTRLIKEGMVLGPKALINSKRANTLTATPLEELASFAEIYVVESNSKGAAVEATVDSKNANRLYEWIKTYADINYVDEIAPGLMEAMKEATDGVQINDSVASRFAKYRKLYEDNDPFENLEEGEDEESTEEDKDKDDNKDDNKDSEDEDEEVELTAIVIQVNKSDVDAAKQELIDAGVNEDDIEVLDDKEDKDEGKDDANESEDEDEDEDSDDSNDIVEIRVSADSYDSLKEYLDGKGIDLEDKLGGSIEPDKDDSDNSDDNDSDEDDTNFDDLFDGGDLFGDDDTEDKKEDKE